MTPSQNNAPTEVQCHIITKNEKQANGFYRNNYIIPDLIADLENFAFANFQDEEIPSKILRLMRSRPVIDFNIRSSDEDYFRNKNYEPLELANAKQAEVAKDYLDWARKFDVSVLGMLPHSYKAMRQAVGVFLEMSTDSDLLDLAAWKRAGEHCSYYACKL